MNPELPETDTRNPGTPAAEGAPQAAPAAAPAEAAGAGPVEIPAEAAVDMPAETATEAAAEMAVDASTDTAVDAPAAAAAATTPKPAELSPAACAAALAAQFPALFAAGAPLPVKLRIQTDIQQRAPGLFSRKALSLFLHRHTTSTAYIRALLASAHRFDLDGQPAGEISEEHRAAAVTEIDRRKAIVQERRAAERQLQRPQQPHPQQPPRQRPPHQPLPANTNTADAGLPSSDAGAAPPPQPNPRHQRPAGLRPPRQDGLRRAQGPAGEHTLRGPENAPAKRPAERANAGAPEGDRGHRRDVNPNPNPNPNPNASDPAADAARRERSALLRTFEGSTLTKANFLVLKRLTEADLDAQLALARQERQQQQPPQQQQPQQPPHPTRRDDRPNRR